jgi:cell division protein FtsB
MNKIFLKLKVLIKKSLFKYLVISISFLIWMTFLDTNSLLIHAELNREIKKLKKKRDALNKEILNDKSLIEKLNNIDSLEHYAREEYNLKKENEDIFIIEFHSENE